MKTRICAERYCSRNVSRELNVMLQLMGKQITNYIATFQQKHFSMSPRTKIFTTNNSKVILINYPFKKSFLNQKLQLHNNNHCFIFVSFKIARLKFMKLKMNERELNSSWTSSWIFLTSSSQCDINSYYKFWFDGDYFNTKSSSEEATKSSSNC